MNTWPNKQLLHLKKKTAFEDGGFKMWVLLYSIFLFDDFKKLGLLQSYSHRCFFLDNSCAQSCIPLALNPICHLLKCDQGYQRPAKHLQYSEVYGDQGTLPQRPRSACSRAMFQVWSRILEDDQNRQIY